MIANASAIFPLWAERHELGLDDKNFENDSDDDTPRGSD
jgi:hypothetical protein